MRTACTSAKTPATRAPQPTVPTIPHVLGVFSEASSDMWPPSPRVCLGRLAARAWPDAVQPLADLVVQRPSGRLERALELRHRSRADDGCRHSRLREQPCQRHFPRRDVDLPAERLVRLDLRAVLLDRSLLLLVGATSLARLGEHAPEHATAERAPWQHTQPVRARGRQYLKLDRARRQIVETLLGDEPEEM